MSLQTNTTSIKRAITLLAIPAVLAASVLTSAPAQAATTTAGSVVSRTDAAATASVAQPLTRAQLRAEVVAAKPSMRPAEVEAVTDLLATQAASAPQVIPALILAVIARCALGSMSVVALNEVVHLITTRQTASAETRIAAAITGCVGRGLPPHVALFLRNAVLRKAAAAAIVVAMKLRQICIPRCI